MSKSIVGDKPRWFGAIASVLLGCVACSSDDPDNSGSGDTGDTSELCTPDSATDAASAIGLIPGETAREFFCPRSDRDFYRVTTTAANQLVSIVARYTKLSDMRLSVDWADSSGNSLLSTPVSEPLGVTSDHLVQTQVAAPVPGDYILSVFDLSQQENDFTTSYSLDVALKADPDAFEPNEDSSSPTVVTLTADVQTELSGFLAAVGDVDTYRFEYAVTPATPVIVELELSWPNVPGAPQLDPTFELIQDSFTLGAPRAENRGAGSNAERFRAIRRVLPGSGPLLLTVTPSLPAFDDTFGYTLRVLVTEDANEGNSRNDVANTAVEVVADAFGEIYSTEHTIVADNDDDWFRVNKANEGDASLLRAVISAPPAAEYSLRMSAYTLTDTSCSDSNDCGGNPCVLDTAKCLEFTGWQRPAPDGPSDPQLGGLSPNYLEGVYPLFDDASSVFFRIGHASDTLLDVPGFGDTPYTVAFEHLAEPDSADLASTSEEFIARPIGARTNDFVDARQAQEVTPVISPPPSGLPVAQFAPGSVGVIGSCRDLTIEVFDLTGQPTSGEITIGLTAPGVGQFLDVCGGNPAASTTTTDGIGTIAYDVEGSASETHSVIALGDNVSVQTVDVSLSAMAAANPVIRFSSDSPHRAPTGIGATFSLEGVAAGTTASVDAGSAELLFFDGTPEGETCTPPCSLGNGETAWARQNSAGIIVLTATAGGHGSASWVMVAQAPQTLTAGLPLSYISYDGDQDWFSLDATGLPPSFATIDVNFPASPVDLRVSVLRGEASTGFGNEDDQCGDESATCDDAEATCNAQRNTCDQEEFVDILDDNDGCTYLSDVDDDAYVWVNDTDFNDSDTNNAYNITVTLVEGCPVSCPPNLCR